MAEMNRGKNTGNPFVRLRLPPVVARHRPRQHRQHCYAFFVQIDLEPMTLLNGTRRGYLRAQPQQLLLRTNAHIHA